MTPFVGGGEGDDDHGRRVVDAGLGLEDGRDPGPNRIRRSTENTAAASVDDTIAPIRTAERQSPEHRTSDTRDDANADQDADRCQGRAHPEHRTDVGEPTGETALREDHDERDES